MTSQFPDLNSKQMVKIAEKIGFTFIRQSGSSHAIYMRDSDKKRTTIPIHGKKSLKSKTIKSIPLNKANKTVQDVNNSGQEVLVVCEKKMYATEMKTLGERYWVSYLNYKAPGWFLTNFDTFKTRISSMNKMSAFVETEEFASLTKKEQLVYKRKLSRTKKIYEWVKNLTTKPWLVIVVDGSMMRNFVRELPAQWAVDSIVISSTNYDQYLWDNDIIANMLSYKSIDFVMNYILS